MNKILMLGYLLQDADTFFGQYDDLMPVNLEEAFNWITGENHIALPINLPKKAEDMISVLRQHFQDDVTLISLVLSHYFPHDYIYYRVSKLEPEIFAGFEFFADIVPEFEFSFDSIGKTGVERYLKLNESMVTVLKRTWPTMVYPQKRALHLLYNGFGRLFLERDDAPRYWVNVSSEASFAALDQNDETLEWSGRKEMRANEVSFIYRMAPRTAITDVCTVIDEPVFDPWGGWDGFWVELAKLGSIPDIPLKTIKEDKVLGAQWGTARKNFQGVVTEQIPDAIYNRLLELIPQELRQEYQLTAEPVAKLDGAGLGPFTTEEEFRDKAIVPLLNNLKLKYKKEHLCRFQMGGQTHPARVDFLVSDASNRLLTVMECKLKIISDAMLQKAVAQAKSYALQLGSPSFVVAAPQGFWLYAVERNRERLVGKVTGHQLKQPQTLTNFKMQLEKLQG